MPEIFPEYEGRRLLGRDDEPMGAGAVVAVWYGDPQRQEIWCTGLTNRGNWYPLQHRDATVPVYLVDSHQQWDDVLDRGPVVLLVPVPAVAYDYGWRLGRRELLHRLQDLIDTEPDELSPVLRGDALPALVGNDVSPVVFGPHCHHDRCAMSGCGEARDGEPHVLHGCREQARCPFCGPDSPDWPRLVVEWEKWCTETYGTTSPRKLSTDGRPANVIRTAVLIAAFRPTEP